MTNLKDKPISILTALLRGRGDEMRGFGKLETGLRRMTVDQLDALADRIGFLVQRVGRKQATLNWCRGCGKAPIRDGDVWCAACAKNPGETE